MLDTNIASELIRTRAFDSEMSSLPPGSVVVSSITAAELHYGLEKKPGAVALERLVLSFLEFVKVSPFDSKAARAYGRLRYQYENQGISVSALDGLIAAHAMATDSTLITRDRAMLRLKPWLKVETW